MNERHKLILQLLNSNGRISVAKLAESTGVSEVTIRNDLNLLEKQNYLKRIHGSAVTLDSDNLSDRMLLNFSLKQKLANYAASLVQPGDTIFIEGGSTNALLARELSRQKDLTIITVSVYIASVLKDSECDVILLGGLIQKKSESVVGPLAKLCAEQIHFNKAFIGIDGFHIESGFTGRDMMRTDVVNTILAKCAKNIIVSDSSKFGQVHLYSLNPTSAINQVITDDQLAVEYQKQLKSLNITVNKISSRESFL